ncbi:MAG: phosphoribosylglycinamide formyltransferase [Paludibacteraceae bacterium]|nr:phosphoribosylglycinamide formyltransferase [Paludibacteraceae bacterium]
MPIRIAIFASGSGSNAENIIRYFSNHPNFVFPVIISNNEKAFVHERAKKLGVPSVTFSKEDFLKGEKILNFLQEQKIDAVVLAGFLLQLPPLLINAYPKKIINIHPALLPKFGGKGMYGMRVHEAVKEAGETETGITIHYVNNEYDAGEIIFQAKCPVLPEDTPETIAKKVHELEYQYFPRVIEKIWGQQN